MEIVNYEVVTAQLFMVQPLTYPRGLHIRVDTSMARQSVDIQNYYTVSWF